MELFKSVVTNVLFALYEPFWFAVILTFFVSFFYLYVYHPIDTGVGIKKAIKAWFLIVKKSSYFRHLVLLIFFVVMILFRTMFYRQLWLNPLQDVMGGWWIWKTSSSTGEVSLSTECFENIALMMPFSFFLLLTFKEKILNRNMLWVGIKVSFIFSFAIENAQLFFRLGTWQLSDLFYNTLGGLIGGILYWILNKVKTRKVGC